MWHLAEGTSVRKSLFRASLKFLFFNFFGCVGSSLMCTGFSLAAQSEATLVAVCELLIVEKLVA